MKWLYRILPLLVLLAFSRSFETHFVSWDDLPVIANNPLLGYSFFHALKSAFTSFISGDYLPFFQLSYWTENALWGLDSRASHAINLLLHLANVFLLKKWLDLRDTPKEIIFFAVSLFALHPVQVESVMWASERKGLLAILFLLLSLIQYEKSFQDRKDSSRRLVTSVLFFGLSFLSKATAVFVPFALAIDLGLRGVFSKKLKTPYFYISSLVLLAVAFSIIRILAVTDYLGGPFQEFWDTQRLASWPGLAVVTLGHYVKSLLWPADLSLMYPHYGQMKSVATEVSCFIFAVMVLVYAFWIEKKSRWKKDLLFHCSLAFLLLLPVLNFFPRGNFANDRYLYLPIILLPITLGHLLSLWLDLKIRYALYVLISLVCAVASYQRSAVWLSSENLWQDTVLKNPLSQTAWNNLALTYRDTHRPLEAIRSLETALKIDSDTVTPVGMLYLNLGRMYLSPEPRELYQPETAIKYFAEGQKFSGPDFIQIQLRQSEAEARKLIEAPKR